MTAVNDMKVLREEFSNTLIELRNGEFPLFDVISKRANYQDNIKWPVNVTTGASSGITATAAAPAASSDEVKTASLGNGSYAFSETIEVTKNDLQAHLSVGAVDALRDLYRAQMRSKVHKLLTSISTYLYTGSGNQASGGMFGLNAVVADAAYAGIDPSTDTAWSAYLDTAGGNRNLTQTLLRNANTAIRKKGALWNALVMNFDLFEKFEEIVDAKEGVYNGNNIVAQMGYQEGLYKGRPVIVDAKAPANRLYFVNLSDMALYTRKVPDSEVYEGLNFTVGKIDAGTSRVVKYEISVFPQLVYADRRSAGCIDALNQ
jgi:hypothetical protein